MSSHLHAPGDIVLGTYWIGGSVGPSESNGEKKNIAPARNRTPSVQSAARRYSDRATPTLACTSSKTKL
jgi:hypothetical protein